MSPLNVDEESLKLCNLGFLFPRFFSDDHWAAILAAGSFYVIVDGDRDALSVGYRSRWIYQTLTEAKKALTAWDGIGDPPDFLTAKRSSRAYTIWP